MTDLKAKVLLDASEWERLLEIEERYQQMLRNTKNQEQVGGGRCSTCGRGKEGEALSQVVMENTRLNSLNTPIPHILPSITSPPEVSSGSSDTHGGDGSKKKKRKWYFLGT